MKDISTYNMNNFPLDGKKIEIEGTLEVTADKISIKIAESESKIIAIKDARFLNNIMNTVPCFVGGKLLYCDHVKILVTLKFDGAELFIDQVHSGTLYREDEGTYNL